MSEKTMVDTNINNFLVKLGNAQLPIFYRLMRRSFLINKQKKEKKKLLQDLSYIFKKCQYQNQANPSVFWH